MKTNEVLVNKIVFREDLYPRMKHNPQLVQQYVEDIELLPPIEINQNNELIDGWHRWTAFKTAQIEFVPVKVTETKSDLDLRALAIKRNATHGLKLSPEDKKREAVILYNSGVGITKSEISAILSVASKTVDRYLETIDKQIKEARKEKIFDAWMRCDTLKEIAKTLGVSEGTVNNEIEESSKIDKCPKLRKLHALYQDEKFVPPIYNIWTFKALSNEVQHFGNSEQGIADNLMYLYTKPFDIVVDPFAGGGSTIDICKKRMRRYYVLDRKPIEARAHEIRKHDILGGVPPLSKRWSDVSLTYLDPPYWKQSEGKYSKDVEDLSNQSLEDFTENIIQFINAVGKRQSKGVVAMLMQPTQWNAPNHKYTDHVLGIVSGINDNLVLENRVSCPYSTQQYTPQMVEIAKKEKILLVRTRELVIWKCQGK